MKEQPEALRLAQGLNNRQECEDEAADELRRLLAENESLRQIVNDFPPVEAELREVSDRAHRLEAQRDALLETLRHAAAIAHSGGLQGMTEWQSLVAVRRLTQPYFERSGSITETHDRLRAAIKAVEGEGT